MATQKWHFYQASILNPKNDQVCDYFPQGMLVVKKKQGKWKIEDLLSLEECQKKYHQFMSSTNTTHFKSSLMLPTFFDMHFHWVQDDVREMPKDSLLDWLQKYTFPSEMKFADKKYALKKARTFFHRLSKLGTLGGACYSSIHEHAINAAMAEVSGDFVIGNVLMNMNSPEALTQSESDSLKLTKKLIKKFGSRYCFTPRFAISTSPKVMKKGSKLADKAKCFKQTHLAETPGEIEFVLSLYRGLSGFKKVKSYTEIYQKTGMLGKRSLMGHGIHLSKKELTLLSKTKTAIIHCPTSNAPIKEKGLGSGLFNFREIEKAKVRWALGSDIGGGPFLSMFDVMSSFVSQNLRKGQKQATYVKALYRATLAGAELLRLEKIAGNFGKNKDVNFIIIPLKECEKIRSSEEALRRLIGPHKLRRERYEDLISKVIYRGKFLYQR